MVEVCNADTCKHVITHIYSVFCLQTPFQRLVLRSGMTILERRVGRFGQD